MKFGFELSIGSGFRFYPDRKLGSGAFGEIYQGSRVKDKKQESTSVKHPQLPHEANVLQILSGGEGIPTIYSSFPIGDCNCLIMDLLGPNLSEVFTYYRSKVTMKHIAQIAIQMITRIEFIHSRHFIHRDIKPENFLIGNIKDDINTIYLIDYGLAKRFRDPKSGMHIPYKDGKSLTGTPKFVSIYTHLGIEQSRRDDLESIGYVLIYLMKGELPWDHCHAKTISDKFTKLVEKKLSMSIEDLCLNVPSEMVEYFNSVQGMQFEDKPDYKMLRELFMQIIHRDDVNSDWSLHWESILIVSNTCINNNTVNNNENTHNNNKHHHHNTIMTHNTNNRLLLNTHINTKEDDKLLHQED